MCHTERNPDLWFEIRNTCKNGLITVFKRLKPHEGFDEKERRWRKEEHTKKRTKQFQSSKKGQNFNDTNHTKGKARKKKHKYTTSCDVVHDPRTRNRIGVAASGRCRCTMTAEPLGSRAIRVLEPQSEVTWRRLIVLGGLPKLDTHLCGVHVSAHILMWYTHRSFSDRATEA